MELRDRSSARGFTAAGAVVRAGLATSDNGVIRTSL